MPQDGRCVVVVLQIRVMTSTRRFDVSVVAFFGPLPVLSDV